MDQYQKFIQEKAKKKRELMGTMFFPRTPVLFIDLSECGKKAAMLFDLLEGMNSLRLTTLVLPPQEHKKELPIGKYLRYLKPEERESATLAADFVVSLDSNITPILHKGSVPIAQSNGDGTCDYNPLQEKGNGFYFKNPTKWEVFAAIVRAVETYQFPYDWENLIRGILRKS